MDTSQASALEGTDGMQAMQASPPLTAAWITFLASIGTVAAIDVCFIHGSGRCSCLPTYGKQILLWVVAGFLFAAFVVQVMGAVAGGSWMYGYFLEYMLSIDNLFVFQLVFKAYSTPESQVDRALFWGIATAVILRLAFFGIGTEILQLGLGARIFFGLLLILSGWKAARRHLGLHRFMSGHFPAAFCRHASCVIVFPSKAFSDSEEEEDPSKNPLVRCIARLLPLHDQYSEQPAFFVRIPKKHVAESTAPAPHVIGSCGGDGDGVRLLPV